MTDQNTTTVPDEGTVDTANRPLAGQTKQYLDDLLQLKQRTTGELLRGINEGYLTSDAAMNLADRLGVERPRVRTRHLVYIEVTRPYRIEVQAYDEAEALERARQDVVARILREDTTDYTGSGRSRFLAARDGEQGRRLRVSEPSLTRPNLLDVLPPHTDSIAEGERVRRIREESAAS